MNKAPTTTIADNWPRRGAGAFGRDDGGGDQVGFRLLQGTFARCLLEAAEVVLVDSACRTGLALQLAQGDVGAALAGDLALQMRQRGAQRIDLALGRGHFAADRGSDF